LRLSPGTKSGRRFPRPLTSGSRELRPAEPGRTPSAAEQSGGWPQNHGRERKENRPDEENQVFYERILREAAEQLRRQPRRNRRGKTGGSNHEKRGYAPPNPR